MSGSRLRFWVPVSFRKTWTWICHLKSLQAAKHGGSDAICPWKTMLEHSFFFLSRFKCPVTYAWVYVPTKLFRVTYFFFFLFGPQLTAERLPPDAPGQEYSAAAATATKPAAAISQPTPLRPFLRISFVKFVIAICRCSVTKSCPILCDPLECRQPDSVHEVLQARILEWVAVCFSRVSSWARDQTCVSCTGRLILYHWATWEAQSSLEQAFSSLE